MMIQVIQRCFSILEIIGERSYISLQELSSLTGLNKSTLCNILGTLVQLGYISRNNGKYFFSEKFPGLRRGNVQAGRALTLSREACSRFVAATGESIVLAVLRGTEIVIRHQDRFVRPIMFDASFYSNLSIYHSVAGRILVSYIKNPQDLQAVLDRHGYPGAAWDNLETDRAFEAARLAIRQAGYAVMINEKEGIKACALPFFDCNGDFAGAAGLTFPLFRGGRNESLILRELKKCARFLTRKSKEYCISRMDWQAEAVNNSQENINHENRSDLQ